MCRWLALGVFCVMLSHSLSEELDTSPALALVLALADVLRLPRVLAEGSAAFALAPRSADFALPPTGWLVLVSLHRSMHHWRVGVLPWRASKFKSVVFQEALRFAAATHSFRSLSAAEMLGGREGDWSDGGDGRQEVAYFLDEARQVGVITLDAAERRNAFTRRMAKQWRALVDDIEADLRRPLSKTKPRALVIRGKGLSFCAGGHLGMLRDIAKNVSHVHIAVTRHQPPRPPPGPFLKRKRGHFILSPRMADLACLTLSLRTPLRFARSHRVLKEDVSENGRVLTELYSSFLSIRRLGVPLVGALHGHCVGGGAGIAMGCCDVRVADRGTLLRFNFGKISANEKWMDGC